jgi:hypothetical protein
MYVASIAVGAVQFHVARLDGAFRAGVTAPPDTFNSKPAALSRLEADDPSDQRKCAFKCYVKNDAELRRIGR